jgi:hypothetical protein
MMPPCNNVVEDVVGPNREFASFLGCTSPSCTERLMRSVRLVALVDKLGNVAPQQRRRVHPSTAWAGIAYRRGLSPAWFGHVMSDEEEAGYAAMIELRAVPET